MRRRAIKNRLCGFFFSRGDMYTVSKLCLRRECREKEWDADGSTGLDVQRETPGLEGLIDIPNTAFLFFGW
jgi:hypothetical protein